MIYADAEIWNKVVTLRDEATICVFIFCFADVAGGDTTDVRYALLRRTTVRSGVVEAGDEYLLWR
jgi:hypothetical protein